jgi:hypothetical protein
MTLSRLSLLALALCALSTGCPPKDDTGDVPEADADTDADADSDTDADSDADADADSDADTDTMTTDDDGDGYSEDEGDCDDTDPEVSPEGKEVPYDGVDNDCDEETLDDDLDGDGFGIEDDCDDTDPAVNPDATEDWLDGIDNDCDDVIDESDERFEVAVLDNSCDCGFPSALDVDSAGQVHVAYRNADYGYLEYTKREADGTWGAGATVLSSYYYDYGEYMDAVCDGADRFQVAYTASDYYGGMELDFIYRDSGGGWSSEYVVDDYYSGKSTSVGWYVGMDVDSANDPSFAYFDADYGIPMVADYTSWGVAIYAQADTNYVGPTGFGTSIALDSTAADHLAFYDPYAWYGLSEEIQYSQLNDDLASIAYSETVSADPGYTAHEGMRTSIAVRSDDIPCVSWWDYAGGDLNFACRDDGWAETTVDSSGSVGAWPAMVITSTDTVYIAYYDMTNADLKLAYFDGKAWHTMTVDSAGDVGMAPSIALDGSDQVYISYYDATNAQLKFATGR